MIEEYQMKPNAPKTPIYFLSDDTTSNRGIREIFAVPMKAQLKTLNNPPILNFLTVAGFFRALGNDKNGRHASVLKKMGISETPEEILHIMYEDDEKYNRAWNGSMRDVAVFTQNPMYTPRFPFNNAIGDLRHDLEQEAKRNSAGSMAGRFSSDGQRPGRG